MNNNTICVVLASAYPKRATQLLAKMKEQLPNYLVSGHVLLIGQKIKGNFQSANFSVIKQQKDYPSIADSRNICQAYLKKEMNKNSCLGMVLDDDLEWIMQEKEFDQLLVQLKARCCDMAFSTSHGDAPIPKEFTRASPLLDVLLSIDQHEIRQFCSGVVQVKNHLLK